ncbi:EAL domain-containing protein [Chelativorans intermedius]|uniref:EAL domain-containing protein n=1 Tax=Chelativorans intermedius TaxID=515947 RepID=A0ABV6D367_9HYPH|nr:EAL domain-containing protein [Chelativorans intermedius]MCT8998444.1 EAL domain-containing protein [Chelativorans intermedius]
MPSTAFAEREKGGEADADEEIEKLPDPCRHAPAGAGGAMKQHGEMAARIEESILVDEMGIETGRYGPYFLKTVYRPVFGGTPDGLAPVGVAAGTRPLRDGRPVALRVFLAQVAPRERTFVAGLLQMLRLRNYWNIAVDGLTLFLPHEELLCLDGPMAAGQAEALAACVAERDIDPASVVCAVGEGTDEAVAAVYAAALRRHGMRIAVEDFEGGPPALALVRAIDAEVVSLKGDWFRRIAGIAVAARLLAPLVGILQREGRAVRIEGINTPAQMRTAVEAGADYLLGDLLHRPKLAGALFDTTSLDTSMLTAEGDKVVPLFTKCSRSV